MVREGAGSFYRLRAAIRKSPVRMGLAADFIAFCWIMLLWFTRLIFVAQLFGLVFMLLSVGMFVSVVVWMHRGLAG